MKDKFITYPFETKKVSKEKCYIDARDNGKSYMDAEISWIKRYSILNMWRDYCMSNGLAYKIRFL